MLTISLLLLENRASRDRHSHRSRSRSRSRSPHRSRSESSRHRYRDTSPDLRDKRSSRMYHYLYWSFICVILLCPYMILFRPIGSLLLFGLEPLLYVGKTLNNRQTTSTSLAITT